MARLWLRESPVANNDPIDMVDLRMTPEFAQPANNEVDAWKLVQTDLGWSF